MNIIQCFKTLFSVLLIVSLFLPLSECNGVVFPGAEQPTPMVEKYLYNEADPESILAVISWVLPFIFVLLGYFYKDKIILSVTQLVVALWCAFILFGQLLFSANILYGGYLALSAIAGLIISSCWGLALQVRQRYLANRSK